MVEYFTMNIVQSKVIVRRDAVGVTTFFEDPENTDYQRYLEWLAAGNVPQPWEG